MSRRMFVFISTLALVFSLVGPAYATATLDSSSDRASQSFEVGTFDVADSFKDAEAGIFIVQLADPALALYDGGLPGLAATSPRITGDLELDVFSAESQAYVDYLENAQATAVARVEKALGRTANVRFNYTKALNGFALYLTPEEAATVAQLPGVAAVTPDIMQQIQTDVGPGHIGAPSLWGGADCSGPGECGEGIIVGVFDTGINPSNDSFADPGPVDSYDHTNPLGGFVGVCDATSDVYDASFPCNDKLIGAWDYTGTGPVDDDGHGSHTAGTAAGNFVSADVIAPTITVTRDISGVAPHANIIAYDVCDPSGCPGAATYAAIDQAITDGVDVINFSIGSPSAVDPWLSVLQQAWLSVRTAGIFVAHSAGNEGPGAATVGSPMAPWMMHVAATTHTRKYTNALVSMTGGDTTPPGDIEGLGFTSAFGPATIVYAGDYPSTETDTPELCGVGSIGDNNSPWPAGTFSGEIVVCDRGTFGRVEKGANVLAAGAGGYILVDNGAGLVGDPHALPGVHITQADGAVLKTWLATGTGHTASIGGATLDVDSANADIMAGFSSRGPNRSVMDMIAPSVAAPGVDIIAPHGTGDAEIWDFLSGTSMASPHAAGAAALLTALHPDWTPAEIQSALMTTANTSVLKEDGATAADPFDMGSGRINLELADLAPLTMDIPPADFTAADPYAGGDPKTLNLPSMANSACVVSCTWTRTVTAEMDGSWTTSVTSDTGLTLDVTPSAFSLTAGETQTLLITADVGTPTGDWLFGEVTLTRGALVTGSPDASIHAPMGIDISKLPVAVVSTASTLPSALYLLGQPTDSYTVEDVEAVEITDLQLGVTGMAKADQAEGAVVEDPTNSTPFDDPSQVSLHFIDVPAGSSRVVAEVLASESPDLDLFLGWDLNDDGIATPNELGCISATGTALEYCSYSNPPSGTWWVIIQNWAGSTAEASDAFTLATAAPGPDLSNLTPSGPSAVAAKTPFDLSLDWVLDGAEDGDIYYGTVTAGTAGASPDDLGTMDVDILITAPAFPAGAELTANIWSDHLTLMWPADTGSIPAESFEVYQDGTLLGTVPATTLEYAVTGLTPETAYDFGVVAVGGGTMSEPLEGTFTTATDFTDDDTSIFLDDIEWLAGAGITKGCNPPANDMFCPEDNLTRGQLAAMLNRALDLPAATEDYFTDDETSVFEADINAIAAAGITFGCNFEGTEYCPDDMVTRGELAAMFDRGLDLAATSTDFFTDDTGHIFEASINRLAEAGITKGCNPPTNDNYCPDDLLTRGQAAAFFRRAFS